MTFALVWIVISAALALLAYVVGAWLRSRP